VRKIASVALVALQGPVSPLRIAMLIRRAPLIPSSEITPERVYRQRRELLGLLGLGTVGLLAGCGSAHTEAPAAKAAPTQPLGPCRTARCCYPADLFHW